MRYDARRGAYILQQRTFWTGLLLILGLIAIGLELSFRVPLASGGTRVGLVLAIGALVYIVLKINFTILLSIQVELYPEERKLILKSLFNLEDVADKVRSVEITYPGEEGPASLAIVAEEDRYELYRWLADEETNKIYECYGRQIARTLEIPLKMIQAGQGRRVTKPSALRFRPHSERGRERALFAAPLERLREQAAGYARLQLPPEHPHARLEWTPTRQVSRFVWISCGALFCLATMLAMSGAMPYLRSAPGIATMIGAVIAWIYWGSFIYFVPMALSQEAGVIHYRVAHPLTRLLYWPLLDRDVSWPVGEFGDAWVAGEPGAQRLYLEFRHELVSIETEPLPAETVAALVFHEAHPQKEPDQPQNSN